jgi:hypothetical protein
MKPVAKKAKKRAKPGKATVKKRRKKSMTTEKQDPKHDPKPHDDPRANPPRPATAPASPVYGPGSPANVVGPAPEDMLTEQEKGGEGVPGVGPVGKSEHSPGPVETIEDQGIGPRTPYPEGNPPPPREEVTRSQSVKGSTDKVEHGPNKDQHPVKKP